MTISTEKTEDGHGVEGGGAALDVCIDALIEKDRCGYIGSLLQGLIHNLNGPLQNISMLVEMLAKSHGAIDGFIQGNVEDRAEQWAAVSGKQQKRFRQLWEQIGIMAEMLQDFAMIQEIEHNKKDVDLGVCLNRLTRIFKADPFFKHHVDLQIVVPDGLPLVLVPGNCLVPAFVYIIKNALLALRQSPVKRLVIECIRGDGRVRASFKDTGIGLDDRANRDALFDLFYSAWPESARRADKSQKHFGFGLYAVRKLLDPHGVKVEFVSGAGEIVVTVDMPAGSR